ncbi:MAG: hypothetical protein PHE51_06625 [Eubacteriales bacterium]|nr:hypothetical protein [Eubacteriales bacterium]
MDAVILFIMILSIILGIAIVNLCYRLYMKLLNVDFLAYSSKNKIAYIILVSGAIWMLLLKITMRI